jgi:hypothetical protein
MIGQLAFENSILKTVLAHKMAPGGLFALSETYQKTGGSK